MDRQKGISLNELLIVVAAACLGVLAVGTYTVPRVAREGLHSAIYGVQTYMQLARVEAIARDRSCRFVVDTENHRIEVLDTAGTEAPGDDILLYETELSDNVRFEHPDGSSAVTLSPSTNELFEARFTGDGVVILGAGEVVMLGGSTYERVQVAASGKIRIQRWDGSDWVAAG